MFTYISIDMNMYCICMDETYSPSPNPVPNSVPNSAPPQPHPNPLLHKNLNNIVYMCFWDLSKKTRAGKT